MNADLTRYLPGILENSTGKRHRIVSVRPLYGGDINDNFRVDTDGGKTYFIKINDRERAGMFRLEAMALEELRHTGSFRIPVVLDAGATDSFSFLLLEYIESGRGTARAFAGGLSALHRHSGTAHGWHSDNYIGILPQQNKRTTSWVEFYCRYRLRVQMELARQKGYIPASLDKKFEKLCGRAGEYLPDVRPSLLHGDLWSGNFFYDTDGTPVLIDPALYYGHREIDLAMMRLFGGFDADVFRLYHEMFPPEPGWRERIPLYQLYPLLVHLNLFGTGYYDRVRGIIERYA